MAFKLCVHCNEKHPEFTCAGCSFIEYCSKECQQKDWSAHHSIECSLIAGNGGKRGRTSTDEEDPEARKMQNTRQPLNPTLEGILGNRNRMKVLVDNLSREALVDISHRTGGQQDFYARLNQDNLFWFLVAERFLAERGFDPLKNYKVVAGMLL